MKPPKRRTLFIFLVTALWLSSTGWLIFCEAYPGFLAVAAANGYRSYFSRGVMVMDQWMKITFHGRQIGYSHTSVDSLDDTSGRHYQIANRTLLQMNVMGSMQRIAVHARAIVDSMYRLQRFSFVLTSTGYAMTIEGKRARGRTFDCRIQSAGTSKRVSVEVPDDAILYSPMTELSLTSLPPGRHVTLRMFNPMTLASQNVTIKSLRRETILHQGKAVEATALSAMMEGMETLSWVDDEGTVLRQETLFGWAMEACKPNEAMASGSLTPSGDMLAQLAVPIAGPAERLATAPWARIRLSGTTLDPAALTSHRQSVVSTGLVTEILVRSDSLPATGPRPGDFPAHLAPALSPSPFIQADDPRLLRKALDITGQWTNSLEAVLAIHLWVYDTVEKQPAASLPSAMDVLLNPRGDCNEHTYIMVGLARAAGIPAVVRVGLTLHNGSFYYHAWPSVYVGRWMDMDPTLGARTVGTGHISLFEGELSEQMKLMGMLGRLKAEIIELGDDNQPSGEKP